MNSDRLTLLFDFVSGVKAFQETLLCGVCLEPIQNPARTKCNHRFCKFCITKAIENGIKKCPSCNKSGLTKRSLVLDDEGQKTVEILNAIKTKLQRDTKGLIKFDDSPAKISNDQVVVQEAKSKAQAAPAKVSKRKGTVKAVSNPPPPSKARRISFELKGKTKELPSVSKIRTSMPPEPPCSNVVFVQLGKLAPKKPTNQQLQFPLFSDLLVRRRATEPVPAASSSSQADFVADFDHDEPGPVSKIAKAKAAKSQQRSRRPSSQRPGTLPSPETLAFQNATIRESEESTEEKETETAEPLQGPETTSHDDTEAVVARELVADGQAEEEEDPGLTKLFNASTKGRTPAKTFRIPLPASPKDTSIIATEDSDAGISTQELEHRIELLQRIAAPEPVAPRPQASSQASCQSVDLIEASDDDDDLFESTPQAKVQPRKRQRKSMGEGETSKRVKKSLDYVTEDKENVQSSSNTSSRQIAPQFVLVTTGLEVNERKKFDKFQKIYRFPVRDNVDASVTHVLAGCKDRFKAERTLKYLQAVAKGKMVISFQWVEDCLDQTSLLDLNDYEALDDSGEDGPKRSRLAHQEGQPGLFHDVQFCLLGTFNLIPKEKLKQLLLLCDGSVIRSVSQFSYSCPGLIIVEKEDSGMTNDDYLAKFVQTDVAVVDKDWIIECLGTYSIKSIVQFVQHPSSKADLVKAGYQRFTDTQLP